jgi:hypothetical protein
MKTTHILLLLPTAIAALLASAAPGTTQASPVAGAGDAQIDTVLDAYARSFWGAASSNSESRFSGTLAEAAPTVLDYTLHPGVDYTFLGVCGAGCPGISLELLDARGAVVSRDTLPDHLASVQIRPRDRGVYRLRVSMEEYGQGCLFGVGLFRGVGPAVIRQKRQSTAVFSGDPRAG